MDNAQIIERLKSLEALITKTEADNPNDKILFTDHTIQTQENLLWMMNLAAIIRLTIQILQEYASYRL